MSSGGTIALTMTVAGVAAGTATMTYTVTNVCGTANWRRIRPGGGDTVYYTVPSDGFTARAMLTVKVIPLTLCLPLGLGQLEGNNICIIPKPSDGTFTVTEKSGMEGVVTFTVTNMLGQAVYSKSIRLQNCHLNEQLFLDKNLANGMYLKSKGYFPRTKMANFPLHMFGVALYICRTNIRMKQFILCFICSLFITVAFGQKAHNLSFKDGKLILPPYRSFETIHKKDTIKITFTDSALTDIQKTALKSSLIKKVDKVIFNLQDPVLNLKPLYDAIWDTAFYRAFLQEMQQVRADLLTAGPTFSHAYSYFPEEGINSLLNPISIYSRGAEVNNDVLKERRVLYRDPYKNWIIGLYNTDQDMAFIKSLQQDTAYIEGWRRLELFYKQLKTSVDSIKALINVCDSCDPSSSWHRRLTTNISATLSANSTNRVLTLMRRSFFQRWLWYTEGIPVTNPFFTTTDDKKYPKTEKNTAFFWTDSAIKHTDSMNQLYTKELLIASNTVNLISLPVSSKSFKNTLWHYDASNNYQTIAHDERINKLADTRQVTVLIHNVPAGSDISYRENVVTLTSEYGPGITQFNSTLEGTGAFITSITGIAGPLGDFLSLFQHVPPIVAPTNVPAGNAIASKRTSNRSAWKAPARHYMERMNAQGNEFTEKDFEELANKSETTKTNVEYIERDGYIYYLSGDWKVDKPFILNQYIQYYNITIADSVVKRFLLHNRFNNVVTYTNEDTIKAKFNMLIRDFVTFTNRLRTCNTIYNSVLDSITPQLNVLTQVISIPTRNLPPDTLKAETDNVAQFRTIEAIMTSEADKDVSFALLEKNKKTGDTALVYRDKVRFGKRIMFDFSAGIGFTWEDYTNNYLENTSKVTEVKNANERFHGIAGLHWYPCKIYKAESSFFLFNGWETFTQRISLFAGIDIIRPRFNYYPGISIDLIPGMKLINGVQLSRNTKYEIVNNTVVSQVSGLKTAGWYTSLNVDAKVFTKLFTKS